MGSLCCAHVCPARAFPEVCFETCEAEGTQPSVFKPTDISPKSSFHSVMTFAVHEDCVPPSHNTQ